MFFMKPKISIVIPSYNEEKKIADCLESYLKQSSLPHEIIVVDGGSKDNTVSIIKRHQIKNSFREGKQKPG